MLSSPAPGWRKKATAWPRADANIGRSSFCSCAPIGRPDPAIELLKYLSGYLVAPLLFIMAAITAETMCVHDTWAHQVHRTMHRRKTLNSRKSGATKSRTCIFLTGEIVQIFQGAFRRFVTSWLRQAYLDRVAIYFQKIFVIYGKPCSFA